MDAGYPENADLVIDEAGVPTLKPVRGLGTSPEAERLGEEIKRRMPERTLISVLARTAYWLNWTRHFGPASGSDPKLKDACGRYILTTFVCGSNMSYAEAARHIPGVSAHEFSMVANRHATVAKLNRAIADVVNKFAELDVVKAWGDGSAVATDGTMVDTYLDNLLAETSIRYGGLGGIAYHYVSDLYIALFSRFIPCGAWEAIYIIDGLLANVSDVKPSTIHADTQGQSFMWTSQDDLRWSEGGLGRVDVCGYGVGFGFVQPQVAGVGREPGPDRAGGDFVGGGVAGQFGWVGLADQERVSVVVLLGDQVAGDEGAGGKVADERQVPHVASPPDRGRGLGQREDGPQCPGQTVRRRRRATRSAG